MLSALRMVHATFPILLAAFVPLGAAALVAPSAAAAPCVSGTITAAMETDGPFAGYYKYTVTITWDTPRGLSNFTLDCNFSLCPEAACAQTWLFDEVAGYGTTPEGCEFLFDGEFNCKGNPSIGFSEPVLKWDALDTGDCEAEKQGSAVLVFYTDVAPNQGEIPIGLVKNGQNVCQGELRGACPMPCPVPTEPTTWGRLKRFMTDRS